MISEKENWRVMRRRKLGAWTKEGKRIIRVWAKRGERKAWEKYIEKTKIRYEIEQFKIKNN